MKYTWEGIYIDATKPTGVEALAITFGYLAFFGIVGAVIVLTSINPLTPVQNIGYLRMVAINGLILGVISITASVGLLSRKRGGRYLALTSGIIIIIASLILTVLFLIFRSAENESTLNIFFQSPTIIIFNSIITAIGIVLVAYLITKYKLK